MELFRVIRPNGYVLYRGYDYNTAVAKCLALQAAGWECSVTGVAAMATATGATA